MRIEDLIVFTDVIRYHSMNIAAEKHFMTPQNLSKIIRNMERELGVILFRRSKKGSDLTEEGEKFYLQIVKVLNEYDKALALLDQEKSSEKERLEKQESMTVKVLCNQGATNYAVLGAYKQQKKEEQYNVFLDIMMLKNYDDQQIVQVMAEENADIVACSVHNSRVNNYIKCCKNYIPMYILQSEFMLMVSKKHPLAKRSVVSVAEICQQKFIAVKESHGYDDVFGDEVPGVMRMDSMNLAIEQVRYSDSYCTLVCKCLLGLNKMLQEREEELAFISLEEKFYGTFIVMLREELTDNAAIQDFVKKIGQSFMETSIY